MLLWSATIGVAPIDGLLDDQPDYSPSITRQPLLASNHEPDFSEVGGADSGITRQICGLASNTQLAMSSCPVFTVGLSSGVVQLCRRCSEGVHLWV